MNSKNLSDDSSDYLDRLVDRYLALAKENNPPSIQDFAKEHPECEAELIQVLQTIRLVEKLAPDKTDPSAERPAPVVQSLATGGQTDRIGGYRLVREAGRGGMGVVYEAIQESLDRRVALKVLPPSLFGDRRARERFQLEAKAAAQLHHSNIVPVHEVGMHDDRCYYAMQFIEGDTLERVISNLRQLRKDQGQSLEFGLPAEPAQAKETAPELGMTIAITLDGADPTVPASGSSSVRVSGDRNPESSADLGSSSGAGTRPFFRNVAKLGQQVASGLHYAHENGVLHRDIKPANLMLDSHGSVWITDFGLAKIDDSNDLTRAGDVVGTLRYMAPERFEGKCDAKSDVYALGITLYELLALRSPFDGSNRLELIGQIKQSQPPGLRSINRKIPHDLQTIIEKAMHPIAMRRYWTAAELADDLERFVEGEPIHARRVRAPERLWLWSKKNIGLAASLASIALLLFLIAIGASIAAIQFRAAREDAREQSELAYNILDKVLFDIQDSLAEIPAASGARQRLLKTALEGFEQTTNQYVRVDNVDRRLGVTLLNMSKIATSSGVDGEGGAATLEIAKRAASRSVAIAEALSAKRPRDRVANRDLAIALEQFASVQRLLGNLEEAITAQQRGIRYIELNATIEPDLQRQYLDTASMYSNLAILYSANREQAKAIESLELAIPLISQTLELDSANRRARRFEATVYEQLGTAQYRSGTFPDMASNFRRAVTAAEALYADDPTDIRAKDNLIQILLTATTHQDFPEKMEMAKRAVLLAEEQYQADPNNFRRLLHFIRATGGLGVVHMSCQDLDVSLEQNLIALALSQQLVEKHPDRIDARETLYYHAFTVGNSHLQLGIDLDNVEKYNDAIAAYERAIEIASVDTSDPQRGHWYQSRIEAVRGMIEDCEERIAALAGN